MTEAAEGDRRSAGMPGMPGAGAADGSSDGRADRATHEIAAARAQLAAAARLGGGRPPPPSMPPRRYAGLVTRAIAFALDAAVIDAIALLVTAIVVLAFSVLHLPSAVKHAALAVGGVAFALWTIGYFATFWSGTGQTPADRLMQIRVQDANGADQLPLRRGIVRFVGVVLSAIPLGAGFIPVLFDDRRRGLHDLLARTVVVHAPVASELPPEPRSSSQET